MSTLLHQSTYIPTHGIEQLGVLVHINKGHRQPSDPPLLSVEPCSPFGYGLCHHDGGRHHSDGEGGSDRHAQGL